MSQLHSTLIHTTHRLRSILMLSSYRIFSFQSELCLTDHTHYKFCTVSCLSCLPTWSPSFLYFHQLTTAGELYHWRSSPLCTGNCWLTCYSFATSPSLPLYVSSSESNNGPYFGPMCSRALHRKVLPFSVFLNAGFIDPCGAANFLWSMRVKKSQFSRRKFLLWHSHITAASKIFVA